MSLLLALLMLAPLWLFSFTNKMQWIGHNYLDKHQGSSKGHVWSPKLVWLKLPKFWVTKVLHCQSFLQMSDMLFMSRGEIMGSSAVQKRIKSLPGRSPESRHCCRAHPAEPPCWLYVWLVHKTPVKGVQDGPWGLCSTLVFLNSQQIWIFKIWNKNSQKFSGIPEIMLPHTLNFIYIVKVIILTILENNVKQCIIFFLIAMLKISEVFCKKKISYICITTFKNYLYLTFETRKR